jgi:4-amino-4-deoxy-L-arabinose transferase-like glycosyltransferase
MPEQLTRLIRWISTHKLVVILVVALVVRVAILLAFPSVFAFQDTGAIHGSAAYDEYAQNLLATGVYGRTPGVPDAAIPPLYSYALAVVYGVFGRGHVQVGLFHTLLDMASIAMLYHIGKRVFSQSDWIAALAGLFYAVYPYLVFQNLTLIDTPFFMTLFHAFVLLMVLLRERESLDRGTWLLAILGGVIFGLSIMARPILMLLAVLVALWFLFRRSFWQTVARLAPVALVGVLVVMPWIIRNYGIFDAFVPMTTTSGANFWQGNSEYTVPYFRAGYDVQWTGPDITTPDPLSREADAERFQIAFDYLRENPDKIPELLWVKFLVHWSIDIAPRYNPTAGELPRLDYHGDVLEEVDDSGEMNLTGLPEGDPVDAYSTPLFDQIGRMVHRYYYGALFFLSLIGVVLSVRQWREVSLLWFVQISMTVMYVAFHPSTRYRVPSDPMLFLFAGYAIWAGIMWWQARRAGSPATPTIQTG